jgi:hypothetical protein
MGASGWWFVLAFGLIWGDCKSYRTPEQIAASAELTRAEAEAGK